MSSRSFEVDAQLDVSILRYGTVVKPDRLMPPRISFGRSDNDKRCFEKLTPVARYLAEFVELNPWIGQIQAEGWHQ